MSRTNSVILPLKGLTLALVIIAAEGHSAAQAPSVSYTTYSGPAGPRSINWVTAGPDGALWFTGSGPSKRRLGGSRPLLLSGRRTAAKSDFSRTASSRKSNWRAGRPRCWPMEGTEAPGAKME